MRRATCWYPTEPGEVCDAELYVENARYVCPHGHKLRQELSPYVEAAIDLAQTSPAMWDRFYEGRGGGLL